jgi:MYXO-CTERM domain-containing protein
MKRVLLALPLLLIPHLAEAATCAGRPTDANGASGYTYEPTAGVKTFDTKRIRVHYATSGAHAPTWPSTRADGVPDYVALAADIGEDAITKYVGMGFKDVPDDSGCTSNGGDGRIDVYLVTFSAGGDGTTVPEACNGAVCSSYILSQWRFIGTGYASTDEALKTVISHEMFHAVQNAYNSQLDHFWAEGTAQWGMKTLHPELQDFERQLPAFFAQPNHSIDVPPTGVVNGYLYGSAIWPWFLSLGFGSELIRLVLEAEVDGTAAMAATDKALKAKGSSLADVFPAFTAWNAATKDLTGSTGYPDGAKYPGEKLEKLVDGANAKASGFGSFPFRGTLETPQNVSLETDATRNVGLLVPIENGKARLDQVKKLPANAQGDVLVVVAGISAKKTDAPFTIHLGEPTQGEEDAGASSSSSSSSGDDGGCRTSSSGGEGGMIALALAGLGLVVSRRRR